MSLGVAPLGNGLSERIVRWRRALHAHPELGFEETWTSDFIVRELKTLGEGIDVRPPLTQTTCTHTGALR